MGKRGKRELTIEMFTPFKTRILITLYWIAGLSGIMLGLLAVNQGFYEAFIDIEALLIVQGLILLGLASVVFVIAIGMVSGTKWALGTGKVISMILAGWASVGTVLAVYTAYDVSSFDSLVILAGIIIWLLVFGIGTGLFGLTYLQRQGGSLKRYTEYVTTAEAHVPQLTGPKPKRRSRRLLAVISPRRCIDCGAKLKTRDSYCPQCGARDTTSEVR